MLQYRVVLVFPNGIKIVESQLYRRYKAARDRRFSHKAHDRYHRHTYFMNCMNTPRKIKYLIEQVEVT